VPYAPINCLNMSLFSKTLSGTNLFSASSSLFIIIRLTLVAEIFSAIVPLAFSLKET